MYLVWFFIYELELQEKWRIKRREEKGLFGKLAIYGRIQERKVGGEWVVFGFRFMRVVS